MRKTAVVLFLISFLLTGCGFFNETYVAETDYVLPAGKEPVRDGIVNITALPELREAIRSTVAAGKKTQTLLFDSAYSGNPAEDLAAACWQVRTEDALCAYCVENIAYELYQIVSYTEALINISYSDGALPVEDILTMPYATDLNNRIAEAIGSGATRLAILISRSTLTAEDMEARFSEVYRKEPGLAPQEPLCNVTLFSGSGTQRLYEILLDTGLSEEEFSARKEALDLVTLSTAPDASEEELVLAAAEFLRARCDMDAPSTVYDALVSGAAGPEGISLGFVELCRRVGLESTVVYGQKDWNDYCWNIVRVNGRYYHIDLFSEQETAFLKSDEDFWGEYRWNVNDYPKCESSPAEENTPAAQTVSEEELPAERSLPEPADEVPKETSVPARTDPAQETASDESADQPASVPTADYPAAGTVTNPADILPDGEFSSDAVTVIRGDGGQP
ncbi:MAG: hypothetical protein IJV40_07040 [Oscillospiraceae bacterium]|nr:hypothetical protein [Oscillospiraceae bacterium]